MDTEKRKMLPQILTEEELDKIPLNIVKKLDDKYEEKLSEFLTSKALCETAKSNIGMII